MRTSTEAIRTLESDRRWYSILAVSWSEARRPYSSEGRHCLSPRKKREGSVLKLSGKTALQGSKGFRVLIVCQNSALKWLYHGPECHPVAAAATNAGLPGKGLTLFDPPHFTSALRGLAADLKRRRLDGPPP
ncbi:Haus Augmin-Like Complex Subunit 3 [Manis pentadactyla]|nr:Haus Augmin-Like Complex Subunit 3 [Manis pentadactyla]